MTERKLQWEANSELVPNGGCVYIYVQNGTTFSSIDKQMPRDKQPNTRFGFKLDFDGNTLAI